MSSLYPLFDLFFEVDGVKKLWIPIGSTFCKGSITLRHKDLSKSSDIYEIFLYIDNRETIEEVSDRYRDNVCKWCGINPPELVYIIEKEWERNIQLEDV